MLKLGDFTLGTSSSAMKQLEDLRKKIDHTQELTKSYQSKFSKLATFNKLLTEGYIKNVNVIVDLGLLLNIYNEVFTSLMGVISKFDEELGKDIDPSQIAHIQTLTDNNLKRVSDFFRNDVSAIQSLMSSMGNTGMEKNLKEASQNYATALREAPGVIRGITSAVGGWHKQGGSRNQASLGRGANPKRLVGPKTKPVVGKLRKPKC
jgi:hypothetical protein